MSRSLVTRLFCALTLMLDAFPLTWLALAYLRWLPQAVLQIQNKTNLGLLGWTLLIGGGVFLLGVLALVSALLILAFGLRRGLARPLMILTLLGAIVPLAAVLYWLPVVPLALLWLANATALSLAVFSWPSPQEEAA